MSINTASLVARRFGRLWGSAAMEACIMVPEFGSVERAALCDSISVFSTMEPGSSSIFLNNRSIMDVSSGCAFGLDASVLETDPSDSPTRDLPIGDKREGRVFNKLLAFTTANKNRTRTATRMFMLV